jgi:translation initiation factor IF-2
MDKLFIEVNEIVSFFFYTIVNLLIRIDTLSSLKHLRDDVQSVKKGVECGLSFTNHDIKFQKGDQIVCYTVRQVTQAAKWDYGF